MNNEIVLIAHNLRSCNNVGSLIRTADGLAISKVYLTGYTPYPKSKNDKRLPHIIERVDKKIRKTSLGAENSVDWQHFDGINEVLEILRSEDYKLVALELSDKAIKLDEFKTLPKIAIIVGREVEGIEEDVLKKVDFIVYIPMLGTKESFNVVQAAAMAGYKFRYF